MTLCVCTALFFHATASPFNFFVTTARVRVLSGESYKDLAPPWKTLKHQGKHGTSTIIPFRQSAQFTNQAQGTIENATTTQVT